MANGRLAALDLTDGINNTVYTVPAGVTAAVTVRIVNRSGATAKVRLAIATSATPLAYEWLDYEAPIPSCGVLDETGLTVDATKLLVAYTDTADVNMLVWGYEDTL